MNTALRSLIVLTLSALAVAARAPACPAPIAGGGAAPMFDCNGNGIEDTADIAVGSSSDDDHDGVPDECQASPAK